MKRFLYILQRLVMAVAALIAICPPTVVVKNFVEGRTVLCPFWFDRFGGDLIRERDIITSVCIGIALLVIELGLWWFMFMLRLQVQV